MSARILFGMAAGLLAFSASADAKPKPAHVFIVVLENESYETTFSTKSPAVYLKELAHKGALLPNYHGIGHYSLDNYLAMVSGQAPNPATQSDCQSFINFDATGTDAHGQAIGTGCVYPPSVSTIANQLEARGLTWKGYMEDMGNHPNREHRRCGHPEIGQPDGTQKASKGDQYASRHDPFVYFLHHRQADLHGARRQSPASGARPAQGGDDAELRLHHPEPLHDGHDGGENGKKCVDGESGGLISADKFLKETVPEILASPAYKHDGLLIVTFDEADGDASACCHEPRPPNIEPGAMVFENPDKGAGVMGPGGGRIGAVLVSRFIKPGTVSQAAYNHTDSG